MNTNLKNSSQKMDDHIHTDETSTNSVKIGFEKILVTLDYPLADTKIFKQALDIAKKYQAKLMICHCLNENLAHNADFLMPSVVGSGIYAAEVWDVESEILNQNKDKINEWLDSLSQDAFNAGIEGESLCLTGNTGEEVCDLAKEWNADLIVMGRRGLTGFSEALLGSVSNYVFHHAPCAVLVMQHPPEKK